MRNSNTLIMNTKTLSFVVWALALFMVACSDKSSYTNVIPKESSVVVSVDLMQMAEKGELTAADGKLLAKALCKFFSEEIGNQEEMINKVVANPDESGLDFRKNVYFFDNPKSECAGILASVSDYDRLTELTRFLVDHKVCESFAEEEGIRYSSINKGAFIAYNDETFLVLLAFTSLSPDKFRELALEWMNNEKENSYTVTEEFAGITSAKADVAMAMTMDNILKDKFQKPSFMPQMYSMLIPQNVSLEDMVGMYALNFDKGKIQLDMEMLYKSDEAKEFAKMQERIYAGKLKGKFLDRIQGNAIMYLAGTCNGQEIYSLLMKNELVKSRLDDSKMPVDLKTVLGSLNGEVVLAVAEGQTFPQIAMYAEVNDDAILKELDAYKDALDIAKVKYGVEDNVLYISNMETPVSGQSLEDTGIVSNSDGKIVYLTIDIKALGNILKSFASGFEALFLSMMSQYVKSYTMYSDDVMNNSRMILCTVNEEENVLKQIVDAGRKNYGM